MFQRVNIEKQFCLNVKGVTLYRMKMTHFLYCRENVQRNETPTLVFSAISHKCSKRSDKGLTAFTKFCYFLRAQYFISNKAFFA